MFSVAHLRLRGTLSPTKHRRRLRFARGECARGAGGGIGRVATEERGGAPIRTAAGYTRTHPQADAVRNALSQSRSVFGYLHRGLSVSEMMKTCCASFSAPSPLPVGSVAVCVCVCGENGKDVRAPHTRTHKQTHKHTSPAASAPKGDLKCSRIVKRKTSAWCLDREQLCIRSGVGRGASWRGEGEGEGTEKQEEEEDPATTPHSEVKQI